MKLALLALLAVFTALPAMPASAGLPAKLDEGDLTPRFVGPLAAARQALDEGRHDEALRRLGSDSSTSACYLRALALGGAGESKAAAEQALALRERLPQLEDWLLFMAGVQFEKAGELAGAERAFAAVAATSLLHPQARLGLARVQRAAGKPEEALAALEPVAALPEPDAGDDWGAQALRMRAELADEQRDGKAARRALLDLWSEHPRSPLAKEAGARLGAIPLEVRVARAERLVRAHHNQTAIAELEPLLPRLALPKPLACRARFALADALRKERHHRRALELFAPVVERCPSVMPQALYSMASSRSIAHPRGGPALYDRLAREFPSFPRLDQVHWFASALELQAGKVAAARKRLSLVARRFPRSEYAPEALFKLFWLDWKAGRFPASRGWLDQILSRYSNRAYERQRAEYWSARLDEVGGRAGQAEESFEKLAADDPASYYGAMALARLEKIDPERAAAVRALPVPEAAKSPWPLATGELAADRHLAAGVELLRLGFSREAGEELSSIDARRLPPEQIELLAHLLSSAGEAKGAHLLARTHLRARLEGTPAPQTRAAWELAYPPAWRPLVERHCARAGVDPDLLQALMREESALDPKVRSWAGAVGLTQLLPGRGASVARGLGWASFDEAQLLDPDQSIELGCAWLGSLLREFDGEPIYAWAAYNAEPERIRRWRASAPDRELDQFVEEIPISETRGYVKRLTRTLAAYRLLYPPRTAEPPVLGDSSRPRVD